MRGMSAQLVEMWLVWQDDSFEKKLIPDTSLSQQV